MRTDHERLLAGIAGPWRPPLRRPGEGRDLRNCRARKRQDVGRYDSYLPVLELGVALSATGNVLQAAGQREVEGGEPVALRANRAERQLADLRAQLAARELAAAMARLFRDMALWAALAP